MAGDQLYPAIVRATALSLLRNYPGEAATRALAAAGAWRTAAGDGPRPDGALGPGEIGPVAGGALRRRSDRDHRRRRQPGQAASGASFTAAVSAIANAFGDPTRRSIYLFVRDRGYLPLARSEPDLLLQRHGDAGGVDAGGDV